MNKKPVVITTDKRGVFFGYVAEDDKLPEQITLKNCRMCVYWSRQTKGVVSLAQTGPNDECRVSHAAPKVTLYHVTSVMDCSPKAAKKWEAAPWK